MTMSAIADWLTGAGESDRPILDQTGLKGTFDFTLEFDPESLGREGISSAPRDDSGPTFTEAMKEQLVSRSGNRKAPSLSSWSTMSSTPRLTYRQK